MAKRSISKRRTAQAPTKPLILTPLTYVPEDGWICEEASKTQPDMSLSVYDMLENHVRDYNEWQGIYTNQEVPRFDDILERKEYLDDLRDNLEKEEAALAELEKVAKEAEKEVETASKQQEDESNHDVASSEDGDS